MTKLTANMPEAQEFFTLTPEQLEEKSKTQSDKILEDAKTIVSSYTLSDEVKTNITKDIARTIAKQLNVFKNIPEEVLSSNPVFKNILAFWNKVEEHIENYK